MTELDYMFMYMNPVFVNNSCYYLYFTTFGFLLPAELWNELHEFVKAVGWKMIFDFNVLIRKGGYWDPSNAINLLKYSARKGYNITGFELGNGE